MVLTDYKLPEFDGIELVKQLRALPHCVDVPIVVITVVDDRRVRYDALEAGATDFLIKPLDEHETRARCANLLELRRHKIVLSDQARVLQYQVDKSVAEIHERELETLAKLAKAGEFRDRTTGNHLTRMAKYSALIGTHLGLAPETVHVLEFAAPMHDIGKIGIPDSVLLKEGPLTPAEDDRDEDPSADRLRHPEGQPVKVPRHGRNHRARATMRNSTAPAIRTACMARTFRSSPGSSPSPTSSTRSSASVRTSTPGASMRASRPCGPEGQALRCDLHRCVPG